jgi:hypothetical protein
VIDRDARQGILGSMMKKLILAIILTAFTVGVALPVEAAPSPTRPLVGKAKAKKKKKKPHKKKKKRGGKRKL